MVEIYTPSRASIYIDNKFSGRIIGKKGRVINVLRLLSKCSLEFRAINGAQQVRVQNLLNI